ncbi:MULTISPECIES: response regulator [Exiguobacterium]|uniref:response regulator n=1 Tax=Exiguobacterium TaxID=33986 RepID=UPI00047D9A17|nr:MULTISPECIES: response regulator [Exiguobacterium]OIN65719.1 hypothetical protein BLD48_14580 [Exiguobacterium sp. KRL4]
MALYLLVDAHEPTRKILQRKLLERNQEVLEAESAEEALSVLEVQDVDVIMTELRLPQLDGVELLKKVTQLYPLTKQIVLTDYMQLHTLLAAVNSGNISRLMTKPLKIDETILRIMEKVGAEVVETKHRKKNIGVMFNGILTNANRPYCLFFEDGTIVGRRALEIPNQEAPDDEMNGLHRFEFPTQFGTYILYQSMNGTVMKHV